MAGGDLREALHGSLLNIIHEEVRHEQEALEARMKQHNQDHSQASQQLVQHSSAELKAYVEAQFESIRIDIATKASHHQVEVASNSLSESFASLQAELHTLVSHQQLNATVARVQQQVEIVESKADRKMRDLEASTRPLQDDMTKLRRSIDNAQEETTRLQTHLLTVQKLTESCDANLTQELSALRNQVIGLHDGVEKWSHMEKQLGNFDGKIAESEQRAKQSAKQSADAALGLHREYLELELAALGKGSELQTQDSRVRYQELERAMHDLRCHSNAADKANTHLGEQLRVSEKKIWDNAIRMDNNIGGLQVVLGGKAEAKELYAAMIRLEAKVADMHREQVQSAVASVNERIAGIQSLVGGGAVTEAQLDSAARRLQEEIVAVRSVMTQSLSQMVPENHLKATVCRLEEHIAGLQAVVGDSVSEHQLEAALSQICQQVSHLQHDVSGMSHLQHDVSGMSFRS